jgi:glycosyltransferase 2 family protein
MSRSFEPAQSLADGHPPYETPTLTPCTIQSPQQRPGRNGSSDVEYLWRGMGDSVMYRRIVFWILAALLVWYAVARYAELSRLLRTLVHANWLLVLAAGALECIYHVLYCGVYKSAFDVVGVRSRIRELISVHLSCIFINVLAPTGGTAGSLLFVDDAARRKESASKAAAGVLLTSAADMSSISLLLIPGLYYLYTKGGLTNLQVVGGSIFMLITVALGGILLAGVWWPTAVSKLICWSETLVNSIGRRILRRQILPADWAGKVTTDLTGAAEAIGKKPKRIARTLGVALAAHLIDMFCLATLFYAFGEKISFGPLMAGYAVGMVFWIVSPTPQGVGVVEGTMALVYTSLGVPAEKATLVVLAFRGFSFWMPVLAGFLLLRRTRMMSAKKSGKERIQQHE